MKKILLILYIFYLNFNLYSLDFFRKAEIENRIMTMYSFPIGQYLIKIEGIPQKHRPEKLLIAQDSDGNVIFEKQIYMLDNDNGYSFFIDDDYCCFKIRFLNDTSSFIFVFKKNGNYDFIKIEDKWVASLIVFDSKIYYSTEFVEDTLRVVDIENKVINVISGYYPNVDLNISNEGFCVFEYQNRNYKITNEGIVEIEKPRIKELKRFSDFRKF